MKNKIIFPKVEKGIVVQCPKCACLKVIKRGTRKTIYRGVIQRYACKKCDYKFSIDNNRQRVPEELIAFALTLLKKGKSSREISRIIEKKFKIKISHPSIFRWAKKFENYKTINYDKRFLNQLKRIEDRNNRIKKDKLGYECFLKMSKEEITNILLISRENHISRWRINQWGICKKIGTKYFIEIEKLKDAIKVLSNSSPTVRTSDKSDSANAEEFNMGDKVTPSASPKLHAKSETHATSHHPNIKRNSTPFFQAGSN